MGLFDIVRRAITGAATEAVENSVDVGVQARQIVREKMEQVREANAALIEAKTTRELIANELSDAEAEVTKWTNAASNSAKSGNKDLARECLEAKNKANNKVINLKSRLSQVDPQIKVLQDKIDKTNDQISELNAEADMMDARSKISAAQTKTTQVLQGMSNNDLDNDFDNLRDRVDREEARAKVITDDASRTSGDNLEERVNALNKQESLDNELEQLMQSSK